MIKGYLYNVATDKAQGGIVPFVQCILWLLSWIFHGVLLLRRVFYGIGLIKKHKLSRSVISVGNITVGGVGKTPLVEYIAQHMEDQKLKPVILTRGYMEKGTGSDDQTSDEALMLQNALNNVPVLVGADRVKSAQTYLEHNAADVFILDDGFQRWRIRRDLDIVVIDATNPWGNGHLLPRGILREKRYALKRAHIVVLTKADLAAEGLQTITNEVQAINPESLVVEAIHKPICFVNSLTEERYNVDLLKNQRVSALSSIGTPDSFKQTLLRLDCDLKEHYTFMDHYRYTQHDIQTIVEHCLKQGITTIVTTEKDIVKLRHFWDVFPDTIRLLSLRIKIAITQGEDQFLERITRIS